MTITPIRTTILNVGKEAHDYITEFNVGLQTALGWVKTHPTQQEAQRLADIHMEIRAGEDGDWSTYWLDASLYPTFLAYLEQAGQGVEVLHGPTYTAQRKAELGNAWKSDIPWERTWYFHSESAFWQGVMQGVYIAVNL
ncbi:hypothetical protein [Nonomuraea typhae]|uniref:hypothetical protein n=1 Tax=Nonomuraea typhae TaxID=2603600 RepID=UPI0012FB680B|nr:hypothetical protein [Nonomuraea typhae]